MQLTDPSLNRDQWQPTRIQRGARSACCTNVKIAVFTMFAIWLVFLSDWHSSPCREFSFQLVYRKPICLVRSTRQEIHFYSVDILWLKRPSVHFEHKKVRSCLWAKYVNVILTLILLNSQKILIFWWINEPSLYLCFRILSSSHEICHNITKKNRGDSWEKTL